MFALTHPINVYQQPSFYAAFTGVPYISQPQLMGNVNKVFFARLPPECDKCFVLADLIRGFELARYEVTLHRDVLTGTYQGVFEFLNRNEATRAMKHFSTHGFKGSRLLVRLATEKDENTANGVGISPETRRFLRAWYPMLNAFRKQAAEVGVGVNLHIRGQDPWGALPGMSDNDWAVLERKIFSMKTVHLLIPKPADARIQTYLSPRPSNVVAVPGVPNLQNAVTTPNESVTVQPKRTIATYLDRGSKLPDVTLESTKSYGFFVTGCSTKEKLMVIIPAEFHRAVGHVDSTTKEDGKVSYFIVHFNTEGVAKKIHSILPPVYTQVEGRLPGIPFVKLIEVFDTKTKQDTPQIGLTNGPCLIEKTGTESQLCCSAHSACHVRDSRCGTNKAVPDTTRTELLDVTPEQFEELLESMFPDSDSESGAL